MTAAAGTDPLIRVSSVSKSFVGGRGDPVRALDEIELDVGEGEFLAIVGRSGCGKSTLLRILAGLIPASTGSVTIAGSRVSGPRRDVGLMFQRPALLPWRSVLENVLLPIDVMRLGRRAAKTDAEELLTLVGLEGFEGRRPYELSGGMQQRVALCRSLIHEPKVLLMDEPFAALDALTREELSLELQRLWEERRKTIVFVTHSISEAVVLANRVVVMTPRPGRIARIVAVDVPRPRAFGSTEHAEDVARCEAEVRELLFERVAA
jgi:NitT/TauT family transport system ATP-binding protein